MILKDSNEPVYSSSNKETQEFTILADSKAFKVLSSNLYKNKIRAIIRELSTNALDGHIAANTPERQFDIHLPTLLDPSFWIRDYGTGMSKEQIFNLYTTYFASTKSDSNDFVGALGLGSKSPFSYVNSFTVISYQDGTMIVYTMSLVNGIPKVSILMEGTTEEENGIKISLAIKSDDIERFESEAEYVYKTFKVKPNFVGKSVDCELKLSKQLGISTSRDCNFDNRVYAVMGNIPYPIPSKMLPNGSYIQHVSQFRSVFVEFELGELDITPSREELSLDDDTINTINKRLESITAYSKCEIDKQFEGIVDPRIAYKKAYDLSEYVFLRNQVKIGDKTLSEWSDHYNEWGGEYTRYVTYTYDNCGNIIVTSNHSASTYRKEHLASIDKEKIYIFIDDYKNPMKTLRNLHWYMPEIAGKKIHRFGNPWIKTAAIPLIKLWNDESRCIVIKNSEVYDLVMDAIPKSERDRSGITRTRKPNAVTLRSNGHDITKDEHFVGLDDIDSHQGYYVNIDIDQYVWNTQTSECVSVDLDVVSAMMKYLDIDTVLCVRKPHWKRITKNSNAVSLIDFLPNILEDVNMRKSAKHTDLFQYKAPEWLNDLRCIIPDALQSEELKKNVAYPTDSKYNKIIKLMDEIRNDHRALKLISKKSKKNINAYFGMKRAMENRISNHNIKLDSKYQFIKVIVQNTNVNTFDSDEKERLELLINAIKETNK